VFSVYPYYLRVFVINDTVEVNKPVVMNNNRRLYKIGVGICTESPVISQNCQLNTATVTKIFSRVLVTKDGVRIGNWIY
jgi:hypothetical protein